MVAPLTLGKGLTIGNGVTFGASVVVPTYYVGTIDSSEGNPFKFKVRKSDNLGMAAAITNSGWILSWTDPRFDNGGFTAPQVNVRTQTGGGFTSIASEDATFYNFAGWFGAAVIPQGTQFTINW